MASTYVNDLRLNEMATGDQSGSWGTVTNTNLELIAEAFSFGTEGITTNADTHTTTIADGATDPGRSMFLKYTGTLDSACTITIAPNTVSKLWFIENGTSGSQNIIIKQGSGATITIPPGDTKAIYSDGAGSGGKMVDAFASLSVVDLKVQDDLTVTDDVAIGGLATIGETLAVTGVLTTTAATVSNGGGQFNGGIVVGVDDTGYDVKMFGATSGRYMEWDASENQLFLRDNTKLVFGNGSDFEIYSGGSGAKLHANNGVLELEGDSVQIWNAAADEAQAKFTANGEVQLYFNGVEKFNTTNAGVDISGGGLIATGGTGNLLEISGSNATNTGANIHLHGNTHASASQLHFKTGSTTMLILGGGSIQTPTSGTSNTRLGVNAGDAITANTNFNVCIGDEAGTALNGGDNNTAVGYQALDAEDTGGNSTAIGHKALSSQNNDDVNNYNTAVGSEAGITLTTGIQNVFVGGQAAKFATTTTSSTFVGHKAGLGIEGTPLTGNNNTAIGQQAGLVLQGAAANNTFVGHGAGLAVTTGDSLVYVGRKAGFTASTSRFNTFVGDEAGGLSTGGENSFFGNDSGYSMTTGTKNTIIGIFNGNQHNLDFRAEDKNIVLSDGDGKPKFYSRSLNTTDTDGVWFASNMTAETYWPMVATANGQNACSMNNSPGQLGVTTNSSAALFLNRNNADGDLVLFYSTGTSEGSISVSGTTVSYNGGHLSRWSQLADGSKDASIVKGTVLTNLDQMAVWEHAAVSVGDDLINVNGEVYGKATEAADAYNEDNEQLNCMAVSSVEGDANVSGVFVNWDADDDMNIAMTGDMVIRIAKGTTVARGDLLMSAGDGTAKPQGDDIVRSKTIAKVTSTQVSNTYDDGTYCVPCVLMAC